MRKMFTPRSSLLRNHGLTLLSASVLPLGLLLSNIGHAEKMTDSMEQNSGHHHTQAQNKAEDHSAHIGAEDHSAHMGVDAEDHSAHMKMMSAQQGYERSTIHYSLPDIELIDADGKVIQMQQLLSEDRPVILNFIFTSCTTVCPILSATLSKASKAFKEDEVKPLMISISIDPEYDTPARLQAYAKRYNAGENWRFLTGDVDSVITLQRAFSAYYGNKLNHQPVSFLRQEPGKPWVRLQGFTTSAELVAEYRALFDSRS